MSMQQLTGWQILSFFFLSPHILKQIQLKIYFLLINNKGTRKLFTVVSFCAIAWISWGFAFCTNLKRLPSRVTKLNWQAEYQVVKLALIGIKNCLVWSSTLRFFFSFFVEAAEQKASPLHTCKQLKKESDCWCLLFGSVFLHVYSNDFSFLINNPIKPNRINQSCSIFVSLMIFFSIKWAGMQFFKLYNNKNNIICLI